MGKTLLLATLIALLAGCAAAPIPPTYSQQELAATCERVGGRWLPDELMGGYCETPGRL
jgi:hypothetical protein